MGKQILTIEKRTSSYIYLMVLHYVCEMGSAYPEHSSVGFFSG